MKIHLPPQYAGLAQYRKPIHAIDAIEIVSMTDIVPFCNPSNPETNANIQRVKEGVARSIIEAKESYHEGSLAGTFEVRLAKESEEVETVKFLWALDKEEGALAVATG